MRPPVLFPPLGEEVFLEVGPFAAAADAGRPDLAACFHCLVREQDSAAILAFFPRSAVGEQTTFASAGACRGHRPPLTPLSGAGLIIRHVLLPRLPSPSSRRPSSLLEDGRWRLLPHAPHVGPTTAAPPALRPMRPRTPRSAPQSAGATLSRQPVSAWCESVPSGPVGNRR